MRQLIKYYSRGQSLLFFVVCFLTTLGIAFESMLIVATLGVLVTLTYQVLSIRSKRILTTADMLMAMLFILGMITIWISPLNGITTPQVFRLWLGMLFYWSAVIWIQHPSEANLLYLAMTAIGLAFSVLAFFSVPWPVDKLLFLRSIALPIPTESVTDVIHPNVMAGYLVLLLPLAISMPLFAWRKIEWKNRLFYCLSGVIMLAVLLLTRSRGALLSFVVVSVFLLLFRLERRWLIITLTLIIISIPMIIFVPSGLGNFVFTAQDGSNSLANRIEIWSRGIYMVQDFPITGIGMGLYGRLVDRLYPLFISAPGSVPHAHNLFLQVAVDLGIPGLIAWLGIFLTILAASWQVYRTAPRESWQAALGAGLMGSNIALAVHGLTDAVTWGMVRPAPLVWLVWGLAAAALNIYVKPQPSFDTGKV